MKDPEKLCVLIGMCSTNLIVDKLKSDNEIYCYACQYAMAFIDHELKNNKTEKAIISTLDLVCKLAPAEFKKTCNSIISTYGIYLVQLLEKFADPKKVCMEIKLCY